VQPPRGERTGTLDAVQRRQLDEIFRNNERFLRSFAQRLCRSSFEPGDLVQDTLERCTRRGLALISAASPRAWMARVMRNLFIDRVRRCHGSPAVVPFDDQAPLPIAERRAWWEDLDATDVRAALHEVASQHRRAFELFAFKGCSYSEIASGLGITPGTVGTRILRARRQLKQIIAARHDHGRGCPGARG
jgi:RNA polymerase sigma-70 factor (ECF subfamily)